jgi:hypothetical protein
MNWKINHCLGIVFLLAFKVAGAQADSVLVCKGTSAYAYHDRYCQGLKRCKASIVKVSLDEAIKMNRKACGFCYGSGAEILSTAILASGFSDELRVKKKIDNVFPHCKKEIN